MSLKHLSLFSGIGGIDLAAHWAGFETVAFCEQNKFCQQVLGKHWPGVPIYDDIFTLTGQSLVERGIEPGSVTLISGGFPCQPYSFAGKRVGNADDRALWPQMLRVIREVRPLYVLGENVPGLISLALDGVLSDLEGEGYTCQPVVLPACAVNAPHQRNRVFIIAHANSSKRLTSWEDNKLQWTKTTSGGGAAMAHTKSQQNRRLQQQRLQSDIISSGEDVPNTESQGFPLTEGQLRHRGEPGQPRFECSCLSCRRQAGQWSIEPAVGRMANGVPGRVDRLKSLGNAVVPQQVYPILKAIADYEMGVAE